MKKTFFVCVATTLLFTSCASILSGSKAKVTVKNDEVRTPVSISYDGKTENNIFLPYTIKVKRGFSPTTITTFAPGYENSTVKVKKTFNGTTLWNILLGGVPGMAIDAATGAMMKPTTKEVFIPMHQIGTVEQVVTENTPTIATEERVSRDNVGGTSLERTIIRWYFDSAPQGARVFWRVISSIPDEVKNTNELFLGNTPFEETRSFNILGLTYENSRDVQIEIKVKRKGYMDQTKRFNIRQAIDQQEISSFFDLVEDK
ncbi:MAG: hypothetical protein J1F40_03170 [Prevotellaceae bacterium]|nr:hypothetical protein [Prevotellaceae bacterium]